MQNQTARLFSIAILLVLTGTTRAQVTIDWTSRSDFPNVLELDAAQSESYSLEVDHSVATEGERSLRIDCRVGVDQSCNVCFDVVPGNDHKSVRISSKISAGDVSINNVHMAAFASRMFKPLNRSTSDSDWIDFSGIVATRDSLEALRICANVPRGLTWVDDVKVKPVTLGLNSDREFDTSSGYAAESVGKQQIMELALAGKLWGFLKNFDRRVTSGKFNWDYELFRLINAISQRPSEIDIGDFLHDWINSLGPIIECDNCVSESGDFDISTNLHWIEDEDVLPADLKNTLLSIHRNRPSDYERIIGVNEELAYEDITWNDAGYRLLTLFRMWSLVEYQFPYRNLIDTNWHALLPEYTGLFLAVESDIEYSKALHRFAAEIDDNHVALRGTGWVRWAGRCQLPFRVEYVENRPIVVSLADEDLDLASGIAIGSQILTINEETVSSIFARLAPLVVSSNHWSLQRNISSLITRGDCGPATITHQTQGRVLESNVEFKQNSIRRPPHVRQVDGYEVFLDDIVYISPDSYLPENHDGILEAINYHRKVVIDLRGGSNRGLQNLARHFARDTTAFAVFSTYVTDSPGTFLFSETNSTIEPRLPNIKGEIAILVDERTQSSLEFLTMTFDALPNSTVIGGRTAGADGSVKRIPLPGGLIFTFSGLGVFYPDRTPTQQVGIIPDIEVSRTIEGVSDRRDEVLEAAIQHLSDRELTKEELVEATKINN